MPDLSGTYVVALRVTDAAGNRSELVTSNVVVTGDCRAPLSATINGPSAAAIGVVFNVTATIVDTNEPDATLNNCTAATTPYGYSWSVVGLPSGSFATLNNAASASPSMTPDVAGAYTLALEVVDAAGNRSPVANKTINVSGDCRVRPTSTITAPTGMAVGVPIALTATVTDPNSPVPGTNLCNVATTPFQYEWSLQGVPTNSRAVLYNASTVSPTLTPDLAGTYTVALVATDAAGNQSLMATRNIAVSNSCVAPLTASITSPSGVRTRSVVQLSATVTNPNTPAGSNTCTVATTPLAYAWSIIGLPAGSRASLNNATAVSPSFTPDVAGTYTVALQVVDAAGNRSNVASVSTVASECSAPLNVSLNRTGTAQTLQTSTYTASVTNTNAAACGTLTPYTYSWSVVGRPGKSTANVSPAGSTATLMPDVAGTYAVVVSVVDALGNTGSATSTTAMTGCGGTANVAASILRAVSTPIVGQKVDVSAIVSADTNHTACNQPTAAPFSYAWTLTPPAGSSVALAQAQVASPTFTPDVAGTYSLAVTVTDALGYSASATDTVAVVACPMTPALTLSVANPVATYSKATITANTTFPGTCTAQPSVTYSWAFASLPLGSAASLVTETSNSVSFTADRSNSSWVVRVTATNTVTGATATTTQTVTTSTCGGTNPTAAIAVFNSAGLSVQSSSSFTSASAATAISRSIATSVLLDGTSSTAPSITSLCLPGPVTYQWSLYAVPAGSASSIQLPTAAKPSLSFDVAGEYVVQLIVSDGVATSAPSFVRFTVN